MNASFQDASDTSWLSSLPQAASSPPLPPLSSHGTSYTSLGIAHPSAPDPVVPKSIRPSSDSEDKSQQDRFKALLKENADLTTEIVRLQDFETGKNMLLRVYSLR